MNGFQMTKSLRELDDIKAKDSEYQFTSQKLIVILLTGNIHNSHERETYKQSLFDEILLKPTNKIVLRKTLA